MHNLTKIKLFRLLLRLTYIPSLVFIYPVSLLRKKTQARLFFFFDRYSIGGAQRVHLDILETVADQNKQVFFTRKSPDDKLKETFYAVPHAHVEDIHFWCDNLLLRLFSVHYFAFYLNRHETATVLSANSTFFYDMLPFLKDKIFRIELLHNFSYGGSGMEFFGLANYQFLEKRMVIDNFTRKNIQVQYEQYQISKSWFSRVQLVEFGVAVPVSLNKDYSYPLKICYAGRGGPQKRVWLIDRIATHFISQNEAVEFHFVGTMTEELSPLVKSRSLIHGEIGDRNALNNIYNQCHALLLTSAYEGFPMVVKETMAYGCVPIVTALEGNKTHLKDGENALLIEEILDEDKLVAQAIEKIQSILSRPALLSALSQNAYVYARDHFTKDRFFSAYRELLLANKK